MMCPLLPPGGEFAANIVTVPDKPSSSPSASRSSLIMTKAVKLHRITHLSDCLRDCLDTSGCVEVNSYRDAESPLTTGGALDSPNAGHDDVQGSTCSCPSGDERRVGGKSRRDEDVEGPTDGEGEIGRAPTVRRKRRACQQLTPSRRRRRVAMDGGLAQNERPDTLDDASFACRQCSAAHGTYGDLIRHKVLAAHGGPASALMCCPAHHNSRTAASGHREKDEERQLIDFLSGHCRGEVNCCTLNTYSHIDCRRVEEEATEDEAKTSSSTLPLSTVLTAQLTWPDSSLSVAHALLPLHVQCAMMDIRRPPCQSKSRRAQRLSVRHSPRLFAASEAHCHSSRQSALMQGLQLIRRGAVTPQMASARSKNNDDKVQMTFDASFEGEHAKFDHVVCCSACGAQFQRPLDVMYHKWVVHPHCLVAHYTWRVGLAEQWAAERLLISPPNEFATSTAGTACNTRDVVNHVYYGGHRVQPSASPPAPPPRRGWSSAGKFHRARFAVRSRNRRSTKFVKCTACHASFKAGGDVGGKSADENWRACLEARQVFHEHLLHCSQRLDDSGGDCPPPQQTDQIVALKSPHKVGGEMQVNSLRSPLSRKSKLSCYGPINWDSEFKQQARLMRKSSSPSNFLNSKAVGRREQWITAVDGDGKCDHVLPSDRDGAQAECIKAEDATLAVGRPSRSAKLLSTIRIGVHLNKFNRVHPGPSPAGGGGGRRRRGALNKSLNSRGSSVVSSVSGSDNGHLSDISGDSEASPLDS